MLKLVSWNVNGIRAAYKKTLPEFVGTVRPDILCLQETKAHIDQVEDSVKTLGFAHSHWSSAIKKGYSGVATFSQEEPKKILKGVDVPAYDSEGRFVITEFAEFELYNIYFPNGGSGEERHNFKQKFLKDLNTHLQGELKKGKKIVVVGDYNVAHTEIDIHDPVRLATHSGFLPEERQWFDSFLSLGFADTFREFHSGEKDRYSWWDYRTMSRLSNRGWRIDYICVSHNLKPYLKSADILDTVEGSDHCPVVVEFSF